MKEYEPKAKLKIVLSLIEELISYDKELNKCPYTLNYILNTIYDYIINDKEIE
jgi:hypothetical protein